jgi:toxin-antitoxin system PIN domain toxin
MKRSTTSCFPDINVWIALAVERHQFHRAAARWWDQDESQAIGFCRFTQMGLLRLLTSAAAMTGRPLTNQQAWGVYAGFFEDIRVALFPEPAAVEDLFQLHAAVPQPAPKLWADGYLAAHAAASHATLVTFDQAFEKYPVQTLILEPQ